MNIEIIIFQIIILVFSAVIHEFMHGWMADRLGDSTAKDLGRLTLNPIAHLDFFGSFLLPALLVLSGAGFVFGWAKPVPYNPNNLRDKKFGGAKVAAAGPLANLATAIFFGLILRFFPINNMLLASLLAIIVKINLLLMIFNLIPIPPLDGSKIVSAFLPYELERRYLNLERYGLFLILFFVFFGFSLILPIIVFLFKLLTGS